MRTLTVKREKRSAGCLLSTKIYVEDANTVDLVINGVPCRKLGTVKNGKESTFVIDHQACRIFAIADRLTKEYCNDCYVIPEGEEDVTLTGKHEFNLLSSNAFRFDNNDNEERLLAHKKASRKGLLVLFLAAVVGFGIGFISTSDLFDFRDEPKEFVYDGSSITLTEEFQVVEYEGYDICYGSEDVAVFVLKEEFSLAEGFGNLTVEQYGELLADSVYQNIGVSVNMFEHDGCVCTQYEYTDPDSGEAFVYHLYAFKGDDAFWCYEFATALDLYYQSAIGASFDEWANTIKIGV